MAFSHRSPTGGSIALLLLALGVAAALTYQALAAARGQRATADAVIGNYTAFAAQQFADRMTRELDLYGLYPTFQRLARVPEDRPVPSLTTLREEAGRNLRGSLKLADSLFRFTADQAPTRPWGPALLAEATRTYQPDWYHALARLDGHLLAYRLITPDPDGSGDTLIVGFFVNDTTLNASLQAAFYRGPLLPTTLTGSLPLDSVVSAQLLTSTDELLAGIVPRLPETASPYTRLPELDYPLGPRLANLQLRVGLQPGVDDLIVIGGRPVWRLVVIGGLALMMITLIGVTLRQVQRERQLTRLRTEFVSNVSHELRTPLAQIRMFAETLRLGRIEAGPERHRALDIIDKEARRLTALVENVLHFSRAERQAVRLTREDADLAELIQAAVSSFAPLARAGGITVITRLESVHASVDRGAVQQIVLNFLDNAVKYGPAGQTVTVTLEAGQHRVRLSVEDEGPGVPPADRERIWDRFIRLPREWDNAVAGAGIGLSVVRELVLRHGGTVEVEGGTRGARFVVEFPSSGTEAPRGKARSASMAREGGHGA